MGNYSMIAFASWDYGSLGDKETRLKQKNILYRLQVRRSGALEVVQWEAVVLVLPVFLPGGSGGGEVEGPGGRSDSQTENTSVLPPRRPLFSGVGVHRRRLGRDLLGDSVQPGRRPGVQRDGLSSLTPPHS